MKSKLRINDGTFKVKIYKQGKKVFEEVVTVDRLDDFLAMVQRVMKRHDEKKSSIKLLKEDFSGVLDIGFSKRIGLGIPWCFYPINYKIINERDSEYRVPVEEDFFDIDPDIIPR